MEGGERGRGKYFLSKGGCGRVNEIRRLDGRRFYLRTYPCTLWPSILAPK